MAEARSAESGVDPAIDVLIGVLPDITSGAAPLLAGSTDARLVAALKAIGGQPAVWTRRTGTDVAATAWPAHGAYTSALVRMPKSKQELDFLLDAIASKLAANAPITVFGANDEGIRSAGARLDRFVDGVTTLDTRRHCRVITGPRRTEIAGLRGNLPDWRQVASIDLGSGPRPWIVYPGLFAHGRLDDGTRLLLTHLPPLAPSAHVLDYAAGAGVIAAAVRERHATVHLDLIDNDALALVAARENVPDARTIAGDRLRTVGAQRYDAILSNPPIHDGVAENPEVLRRLIAEASAHLAIGGVLQFVVQRRVKVRPLLEAAFSAIDILADDGRFTVWRARSAGRKVNRTSRQ